ncbi:hypothetical protein NDU88_006402 [Pleurodeles waltl]|uniref:Uncharacterized protein n=1 Tax=Pleurodeles waltl TaxID=8319 RepID=A0AAV7RRS1_PLEWA|nr:hypothetical protein NDU88_006402 [Pleurodeles waltl]
MSTNTPRNTRGTIESRDPQEPSMSDILNEIKGARTEMVTKIYTMVVDIILLRTDLRKVADRVTEAEDAIGVLNREVSEWVDMVSLRMGSRQVLETDRTEARGSQRARIRTQKPLQRGVPSLAPTGRITVQPDGTLAAEGDELYGQNAFEEQQRHPDSDTDATGHGQL